MAKRIEASGINAYYGAFKAIEDINMVIEPKSVTALIGPSGCGKSTFIRSINRMHEVLPGARVEGKLTIDAQNIYGRDVDVTAVRRMIGMVFQRPNPFPTMSIYDNVVSGLKLNGTPEGQPGRRGREGPAGGEPVERGAHPAQPAGRRPVRRPAAAAVHRPRDRGGAAGGTHGRTLLGNGPDLHARHRGPDQRAEEPVHDHHRHAQHAAGGPGLRPHCVLLYREDRRPRPADRVRRDDEDLHEPVGEEDRGLHHRPLRLSLDGSRRRQPSRASIAAMISERAAAPYTANSASSVNTWTYMAISLGWVTVK